MIHWLELPLAALVVLITILHAGIFNNNTEQRKNIAPSFHWTWAAIYGIVLVVICYLSKSWWLFGVGCLMRFAFYNPLLNAWRHRGVFYITTSTGNLTSWWDKTELAWGKWYPIISILSAILFITLQFFFYA